MLRAFVVDDDAFHRQAICEGLAQQGIAATAFADAASAVAALETDLQPPDVVIADMVMPIVDGLRLTAMVRAHPRGQSAAVLVISAMGTPAHAAAAAQLGADDFVSKPIASADLAARCHAAVARRRMPNASYARVNVAVLFTDVRGFTSFSSHLDPETVVEVLSGLFNLFLGDIQRSGGYLDKVIGDGILALFGAPEPHPTPVLAAVRAAAGIRASAELFCRDNVALATRGVRLQVGSGITYGEAVAGLIGPTGRRDYTAIGDPVNLASRLQGLAQPGEILLDGAAARHAGERLELSDRRVEHVKGRGQVEIFELLGVPMG